jgi:hypothetical protein
MEKVLPCQEKCLFSFPKGERILKNPFGIPIFPMNLNGDSNAHRILHLEPCPTDEPVVSVDEGTNKVTCPYHF